MTPSTLALLGRRVKEDKLIPFEKMHPSIAHAAHGGGRGHRVRRGVLRHRLHLRGRRARRACATIIDELTAGQTDKKAVEAATGMPFARVREGVAGARQEAALPQGAAAARRRWCSRRTPRARRRTTEKKGREISFGDFAEVTEVPARKFAHLGELMRERNRVKAAAEEYAQGAQAGGRQVRVGVQQVRARAAGAAAAGRGGDACCAARCACTRARRATNVHLGRILLFRKDYPKAKTAYLEALASDPFDPEIHLALTRIHGALGETALVTRTEAPRARCSPASSPRTWTAPPRPSCARKASCRR